MGKLFYAIITIKFFKRGLNVELNWNFQEILNEIEKLKKWKTKSFEEEASKYHVLKQYSDLLKTRTANDYELTEKSAINEYCIDWIHNYSSKKGKLERRMTKDFNDYARLSLVNFMESTQNHSLRDTFVDIEPPIINKYNYQFLTETIIKTGDEFFNTMPFMDKNILSRMSNQNLICLSELYKTTNASPMGTFFTTGHILCTYKDSVYFDVLMSLVHEIAHYQDFIVIDDYFAKELCINNIFLEFFAKTIELLALDYVIEKCDLLALDVNLYKYGVLNNQNRHLMETLFKLSNFAAALCDVQANKPKFLLEIFNFESTPMLTDNSHDEKKYYENIIALGKEKIVEPGFSFNPFPFQDIIRQLVEGTKYHQPLSVKFSYDLLKSGKYLLSTLLAMKVYYLIKDDKEKGLIILKELSEELMINYKNSSQIIKKYGLEDYLLPDYIQQYANDYNSEKEIIKKSLISKSA